MTMPMVVLVLASGLGRAHGDDEEPLLLRVPSLMPMPQAMPREEQLLPIPGPVEERHSVLPGQALVAEVTSLLGGGKVGAAMARAEEALREAEASDDWQGELAGLSALASARMASASITPRELEVGSELLRRGLEILKQQPEVDALWVAEFHGKLAWLEMNSQHCDAAAAHLLQAVHASLERPEKLGQQWEQCRALLSMCEFSGRTEDRALRETFARDLLLMVQGATGPEDIRLVTPMDLWAEHQESHQAQDYAGAAATRRAILDIINKHGVMDEQLSAQHLALADLLSLHLNQTKEAEEHYRAALETESVLPGLRRRPAEIRDGLARLTRYQPRREEEHFTHTEEAWKVWKKVATLHDAACRQAQERLAGLLAARRQVDRAEPLYVELLDWHRKQAPQAAAANTAPATYLLQERESLLQDVCRFYVDVAEMPEKALGHYQELLDLQGRQPEANQPGRIRTLVALAGVLQKLGRHDEANARISATLLELERAAAEHPESFSPAAARDMAQFHTVLGRGYSADGTDEASLDLGLRHFQMAVALRRDVLRIQADKDAAVVAEDRRAVVWSLLDMARAHEQRGDAAAAEEHFRRALSFAGTKQGNPGWMEAAQALATYLAGERRHSESVVVLRKILEGRKEEDDMESRQQRRATLQELFRELDRAGDDEGALVILTQLDRNSWNTPWQVEEEEFVGVREARIKLRKRQIEAAWGQMLGVLEKRRERQDDAGLLELLEEMIPPTLLRKDKDMTEQLMAERMGLLRKQHAGTGPLQATLLEHAGLWLFGGDSQRALEALQASQALAPVTQSATTPQTRAIAASGALLEMFTLAQRKDMEGAKAACANLARYTTGTPHEGMVRDFLENLPADPEAMEPFQNVRLLEVLHDRASAGRRLLECAVALCEERHGSTSAASILLREQLGKLCLRLGEHGAAMAHYEAAWASLKDTAAMSVQARKGVVLQNLITLRSRSGDWPGAERHAREMLDLITAVAGGQVVGTAQLHFQLAECAGRRGDREVAATRLLEALRVQELALGDVMHSGTEQDRLVYSRQRRSEFDLVAAHGGAEAIAGALVRQKHVLLDSLLQDSQMAPASGDLSAQPLLGRVEVARASLNTTVRKAAAITLETPYAEARVLQQELETRREEMADAESSFMTLLGGTNWKRRALRTSLDEVREGMPEGSVLLDYYRHREPGGVDCFSVSILPKKGAVKQVRLGDAALIEELIRLYHQVIQGQTDGITAGQVLAALGQMLVAPALADLEEPPTMLILCPDDALQLVSFPTLLLEPDGRFLAELLALRQLSAARDLALLPPMSHPATPLESTEHTPALAGALEKKLRADAKAASFLKVEAPLFFLPKFEMRRHQALEGGGGSTVTHTSGLLLSGSEGVLAAWKEGQRATPDAELHAEADVDVEDGIFTAAEVATLDLRKTALASVSACATRVDPLRPEADGLLALQRAFTLAGAQQVLLTIWPTDKTATAEFMADLQRRISEGNPVPASGMVDVAAAFQEVQREWLVRLRTDANGGIIKAVSTAGPFVMTQGVRVKK